MKLSGTYAYYKALIISKERLQELQSILFEFCDHIDVYAITEQSIQLQFNDFEEMLSYDNYAERKISELELIGYNGSYRIINIKLFSTPGLFHHYKKTVECHYTLDCIESETLFKSKLQILFKKSTARYWLIGKISLLGTIMICSLIFAFYTYFFKKSYNSNGIQTGNYLQLIIAIIVVLGSFFIDRKILYKIFPSVTFLLGEEIENNDRIANLRKNIFWCVIVAMIIGILVTCLYNKLLGAK